MTENTRDDGSVEYAVEQARAFAADRDDYMARAWLTRAHERIQSGAYRHNAEAGRIAAAAVQRIDERNDEVGRLTCSGDERLMYDTLQRIAALTNSTGSVVDHETAETSDNDASGSRVIHNDSTDSEESPPSPLGERTLLADMERFLRSMQAWSDCNDRGCGECARCRAENLLSTGSEPGENGSGG